MKMSAVSIDSVDIVFFGISVYVTARISHICSGSKEEKHKLQMTVQEEAKNERIRVLGTLQNHLNRQLKNEVRL